MKEEREKKHGIKAAILTMSLIQMGTNGMAVVIADIAKAFPNASTEAVQFLMTFPSLFVIAISLSVAWLSHQIPKNILAEIGLLFVAGAGILSFLFHNQLWILFVWTGLLGIGIGLVAPVSFSLISDHFEGKEQTKLIGYQTSASNIGSMIMTFAGGLLATIHWSWDYMVYLLAVPGIFLTFRFIPKCVANKNVTGKRDSSEKVCIPASVWCYCLIAAIFFILFYMGPMNLALFVYEQKLGNAGLTGIAATVLLLGGTIMGMLFGKITDRIGRHTIPMGFGFLAVGFGILYRADHVLILCIGSFLVGASISLVMPQCTLQCMRQVAASGSMTSVTMAMAMVMAFSNIGIFSAPLLTSIATKAMQSGLARSRFLFTAICSVVIAVLFYFIFRKLEKLER